MSSIINTNLASLTAQRNSERTQNDLSSAITRLSSGLRINAARDDAAGLAISARMTSQVRGLGVAARNSLDATSMMQTAEGALASIGGNLQRLRELAVQSGNASNSASDRAAIQAEVVNLVDEIDRVAKSTSFNGQALLDGGLSNATFQVGANAGQTIDLPHLASMRTSVLGIPGAQGPPPPSTTTVTGTTLTSASTISGPGQLVINGVDVWQGSPVNADAHDLAAAINAAGITGLAATAAANVAVGTWSNPGVTVGSVVFNDSNTSLYYSFGTLDQQSATSLMVWLLNLNYIAPGVTASDNGLGLTLTRADGRNISMNFNFGQPEILGLGGVAYGVGYDGITYSHVDLSDTGTAGVTVSGSKAAALGLPPMSPAPPPPAGSFVSQIDLSTVSGANAALATIDASLGTVDQQRAVFGAVQNRFAAALDDIYASSSNASAARSRILDADFAEETANLSRTQIFQQASTAMVAQANQLPQQVMQLLR